MLETSIAEFAEHVRSLMESVSAIKNPSFRKVLYLAMIDGLSSYRFPDLRPPRNRFVRFVNSCGDWPDCDRVSLPQAELLLRETVDPNSALLNEVLQRLEMWPYGAILDLDVDPFLDELPEPRDILRECRHGHLLWALRNTLLHEFRHPGYGFENLSSERRSAYYHGMIINRQDTWELVYPPAFLRELALRCLKGITAWFRSEGIDPDTKIYQGRSWVGRLRRIKGEG